MSKRTNTEAAGSPDDLALKVYLVLAPVLHHGVEPWAIAKKAYDLAEAFTDEPRRRLEELRALEEKQESEQRDEAQEPRLADEPQSEVA